MGSTILTAIEAKKRGLALDTATLREVVTDYTAGRLPDYQMAALLMAVRLRGMSYRETVDLTVAMADSGPRYAFPECVDKHSTGGVGDKLTLTALPLVAACGVPVAKLSGRGLGVTGGTIDKLESIPGWRADLSRKRFRQQVRSVGLVVGGAGRLAPADRAIYALRDATATVDSLPLIGSSIVSKKAATGAGHLLYDVKCGTGAFVGSVAEASELAELLVRLSDSLGIRAAAVITRMDSPLGAAVGNALEVREAVAFLQGHEVPADLVSASLDTAARLVALHTGQEAAAAEDQVQAVWASGAGYETFARFVAAQGGNVTRLESLTLARRVREVTAPADGYLERFDAHDLASASVLLGAGRRTTSAVIDHGAGVEVLVHEGDRVRAGDVVARLYGTKRLTAAAGLVRDGLRLTSEPVELQPHVLGSIDLLVA